MADMVERYLAAVAALLPRSQRDDIRAELNDQIQSQIEDREAELGRALKSEELEALLKAFGNPLVVAARYGRHHLLVGPEMYPFFRAAAALALGIIAAVFAVILVLHAATKPSPGPLIVETLASFWYTSVYAFGLIVGVAVLLERSGVTRRLVNAWRVRDLPPANAYGHRRGAPTLIAETVFAVIALMWLVSTFEAEPWRSLTFGETRLVFAPMTAQLLQISAIPIVFHIAINSYALVRPGHTFLNAALLIVLKTAIVAIVIWMMRQGDWVDLVAPASAATAAVNQSIDLSVRIGLFVALAITAIDLAWDTQRLVRGRLFDRSSTAVLA